LMSVVNMNLVVTVLLVAMLFTVLIDVCCVHIPHTTWPSNQTAEVIIISPSASSTSLSQLIPN